MNLVQEDGAFRFVPFSKPTLPLVEGKCPPEQDEDGNWYYPEPVEYDDPEIRETDRYSVDDKEEFYDYQTTCKNCGTRFIARDPDEELVRNFCPGCGRKLIEDQQERIAIMTEGDPG